jgi:hypothetical protein
VPFEVSREFKMPTNGTHHAFAPEQIKVITAAFDDVLRELIVDRSDPLAKTVAKKMMEIALQGEGDRERLRQQTLQALRQ